MTRHHEKSTVVTFIAMFALFAYAGIATQAQGNAPKEVEHVLANRFAQSRIGGCNEGSTNPLVSGNISVQSHDGNIVIRGVDYKGTPWIAQMEVSPVSECQVWAADLENRQRQDLVILSMGTNSSGGWDSELDLLLLDDNGRPFPWEAIGNFSADENGVVQIVKDAAGAAHIVVPKQGGDRSTGYSYAYNLFGVSNGRMSRIAMSHDGVKWPLMTSPTNAFLEEERAYNPSTSLISAGSRSNTTSSKAVIEKIENPNSMQDERLILSTKEIVGFPKILMIDRPNAGRFIDFDPSQEEIQQLKSIGAGIRSLGVTCDGGDCQPLIVWAEE